MSRFSDLALSLDQTGRMTILHPVTGQPLVSVATGEAAWIDVLAAQSPAGRAHQRQMLVRALERGGQARRASYEDVMGDEAARLSKLVRGWFLVSLDGRPMEVPFSEGAALELFTEESLWWLRDQVATFAADLGNFPAARATT